ncbi:hypothetical protein IC607_08640 [Cellulomonas sp. JH27-2]|uniref:hypothetical protein n=1 Tax=Cellulomonas sp. JH27-2 TaxID=2774139 RepID=UPI00177BDEB2|nr:hypothetical protein [Cellulomonas sp. JH27-2]MBD8059034.1 hypothetical protein [Cellulomonas sp. JH27-2]
MHLLVAARAAYAIGVQLDDHRRWTQHAALTSTDPAVLTLLHRIQTLMQVLDLLHAKHREALDRGWAVLKGDNGHEPDHRPGLRHNIQVVHGGAPGLGKRA